MSDKQNETIADIAAFIRKCLDLLDNELSLKSNGETSMSAEALPCPVLNAKAALDRLDAAWKREQDPAPKSLAPTTFGNAAALREALVWLQKTGGRTPEGGWMCITLKMTQKDGMPYPIEVPPYAEDVINDALSAPPRNCDVGTAEEQSDRFANFCNSFRRCSDCPVKSLWNFDSAHNPSCGVLWEQMPYEAEKGAGK